IASELMTRLPPGGGANGRGRAAGVHRPGRGACSPPTQRRRLPSSPTAARANGQAPPPPGRHGVRSSVRPRPRAPLRRLWIRRGVAASYRPRAQPGVDFTLEVAHRTGADHAPPWEVAGALQAPDRSASELDAL